MAWEEKKKKKLVRSDPSLQNKVRARPGPHERKLARAEQGRNKPVTSAEGERWLNFLSGSHGQLIFPSLL